MRRIFVVMGALLLLVALAGAQATVIKYAVKLSSTNTPAIGDVVKLNSSGELEKCNDANDAIGFVAMIEDDGTDKWGVVVNAGVIKAHITGAVDAGDSLTVDGTSPGDLKEASVGDRVVAVALATLTTAGDTNVLITGMGAITSGVSGAKIWQAPLDLTNITVTGRGDSAELLSTNLTLNNCGVDSVKIQFTGTVDDRRGSGGAVVKVAISDGSGNIIGDSTVVYLVDLAFYQSASVVVTAVQDVSPTDSPSYNVMAWCTNGLTNGRIKGILTVVGTP